MDPDKFSQRKCQTESSLHLRTHIPHHDSRHPDLALPPYRDADSVFEAWCHVSHLVHIDKDTVAVSGHHASFPTLLLSSCGRAQGLGDVELSLIYFAILDCVIDEKIGQR